MTTDILGIECSCCVVGHYSAFNRPGWIFLSYRRRRKYIFNPGKAKKKTTSLCLMEKKIEQVNMQMWQHAPADTVSFQADRSTIKHAAVQAVAETFRQAEPRAVLGGPSPPHTSVVSLVGVCLSDAGLTRWRRGTLALLYLALLSPALVMYIWRVSEQRWQKGSWRRQW